MNFPRLPRIISNKGAERELGFGRSMTTSGRIMNPDGTFNVERESTSVWDNTYFHLVTMNWSVFFGAVLMFFILVNSFFATLYCAIGIQALDGAKAGSFAENFIQAYFFSSQTLTTVGYGHISPNGYAANLLASFESFLGLLFFALISGLVYGRFSRQRAKIIFSDMMLVAPYKEGKGLMFRMGNARKSEILEAEAQIILTINQSDENGIETRKYYNLNLEISKVSFFTLSWTIVHSLDESSPLFGFGYEDMEAGKVEFLILVKGTDEANQNTVHARRSYTASEMVWDARFKPAIDRNAKGFPFVLNREIGSYEHI
jgi:inward rectifier potassium channel